MKTTLMLAVFTTTLISAPAQQNQIIERGPHHRRVRVLETIQTDHGFKEQVSHYTELETGMHYWDAPANAWKESSVEIVIGPNGASATRGIHQAHFGGNLNEPASVIWTTAEGKEIKSKVLGLSYYCRATHQSVWIAELKPEVPGVVHAPNLVVYADAFDSVAADVHFVYRKGGFSATILLLERPPPPSQGRD